MSRFCLDTSAYSWFQRGDEPVVALLDEAEWVGFPAIVLGELWLGFLQGSRLARNLAELREFLAQPVVEEIAVNGNVARIFAEITLALKQAGAPLPVNDLWIAACAASAGATLLTYDAHFRAIERVGSLILTPPGPPNTEIPKPGTG